MEETKTNVKNGAPQDFVNEVLDELAEEYGEAVTGEGLNMSQSSEQASTERQDGPTGRPEQSKAEGSSQGGTAETEGSSSTTDATDEPSLKGEGDREAAPGLPPDEEPLKAQYLRLMADFQNYRRRSESDRSRIYAEANEKLVTELLPVLDNFERALASEGAGEGYVKGMELIFTQLKEALKKSGLSEIEAEGTPFDPNFHQAIGKVAAEGAEPDTVVDVLQKGYILNGKVIRPATVRIAE